MPRAGGDKRGRARDRRVRKQWLLTAYGNGTTCPCTHCRKRLDFESIQSDRIEPGGSYARWNIQPSCGPCNKMRSNDPNWRLAA